MQLHRDRAQVHSEDREREIEGEESREQSAEHPPLVTAGTGGTSLHPFAQHHYPVEVTGRLTTNRAERCRAWIRPCIEKTLGILPVNVRGRVRFVHCKMLGSFATSSPGLQRSSFSSELVIVQF